MHSAQKEWFLPNNSHLTLAQQKLTSNSSRSPPLYSLPPLALVAHVVSSVIRAAFSVWRIFAVVSNVIRGREVAVKLTQTSLLVSHTSEVEVAHWTISFKNTSLFKPDIGPSINSTPLPSAHQEEVCGIARLLLHWCHTPKSSLLASLNCDRDPTTPPLQHHQQPPSPPPRKLSNHHQLPPWVERQGGCLLQRLVRDIYGAFTPPPLFTLRP